MPLAVKMPKLSPTMEKGTIAKWHKKLGDYAEAGETLFDVETDKSTVAYEVLDAGFLRKILVEEGHSAEVNELVAIFSEEKDEVIDPSFGSVSKGPEAPVEIKDSKVSFESSPALPSTLPDTPKNTRVFASPLAKKIAKEKNIDLFFIQGTGPSGRIMSRDLSQAKGTLKMPEIPKGHFVEESMTAIQKTIGERLQYSKSTIPHFYVSQDVSVKKLLDLREQLKNLNQNVSINDLLIKAVSLALKESPEVNSGFNSDTKKIIRFKTIDISVAVGAPSGLITPIIRYADVKSVQQISSEIKQLIKKAHSQSLAPEEYIGGSFTISNLGMFGVSEVASIINPPQAAILGVGGIEDKPIVEEGAIVCGKVMRLTLSGDHRVIDGVNAAKFLKLVQKSLENPVALIL